MRLVRNDTRILLMPYRRLMRMWKGLFWRASSETGLVAHSDGVVSDLARKLGAGFVRHAHADLEQVVLTSRARTDRLLAAWELARFAAAQMQWRQALYYLRIMQNVDKKVYRNREVSLLYIEALTACGQPDQAEYHARCTLDNGESEADYYCALSNVLRAQAARQKSDPESDLARLNLLNRMYVAKNLEEVSLRDPSRGLLFGNLTVAEERLSTVHQGPRISVVLTVRNAESLLPVVVPSILNQTWRNLELVIVDDASSDASWNIVNNFARKDARIVCVRNDVPEGTYRARNRAVSFASGDLIAVHDSREWSHPQMLQTQVQAIVGLETRLAFPGVVGVSRDVRYVLRMQEASTDYLHISCRSLLVSRQNLRCLGEWDDVVAGADEEFVERAVTMWGASAAKDVIANVPMSLRLQCPPASESISENDDWPITSATNREYAKQAEFWRRSVLRPMLEAGRPVSAKRLSRKKPFPIPGTLAPRHWAISRHYELVIISDLTLLGGTRRCNEGYLAAASRLGCKVGLFHWPRYDLRLGCDIASEYRALSYDENVDILTSDDRVSADLVVIHHPPIMKYVPDVVPRITTGKLAILVNQLPQRFGEEGNPYYVRRDVEAACLELFDVCPVWIPISPLVRRVLTECGFTHLAQENWTPPLGRVVAQASNVRSPKAGPRRPTPVIGRHSRDHRTKWPEVEEDLLAAYCADTELPVRFLGGAMFAREVLSRWPENWQDLPFDSMAVSDFLQDLDFFVHFTHSAYVEEFGRNIMEAMAAGVPAVVPPRFREVYGDAACYAEPVDVGEMIGTLWESESTYLEYVHKGLRFVSEFASDHHIERRLKEAMRGII